MTFLQDYRQLKTCDGFHPIPYQHFKVHILLSCSYTVHGNLATEKLTVSYTNWDYTLLNPSKFHQCLVAYRCNFSNGKWDHPWCGRLFIRERMVQLISSLHHFTLCLSLQQIGKTPIERQLFHLLLQAVLIYKGLECHFCSIKILKLKTGVKNLKIIFVHISSF